MGNNRKSFAFRLAIFLLAGASFLFILFGYLNYKISRQSWIRNAQLTADVITTKAILEIKPQLLIIQNVAVELKNFLMIQSEYEVELFKDLLDGYFNNLAGLRGVSFIFPVDDTDQGSFMWSYYDGNLDTLVTQKPFNEHTFTWKENPWNTLEPEWSETEIGLFGEEEKTITYTVPVVDRDTLYGLLNVHVSLNWIDEMAASLEVYQTGVAIIIASNGKFLSHPLDKSAIGVRSVQDPVQDGVKNDLPSIFDEMMTTQAGYFEIDDQDFMKQKVFLIYRPLEIMNSYILLYVPKQEVLGTLVRISGIFLLVAVLSFSLLVLVVFFLTRRMLSPLNQLSRSIMKIGEGDFNVDIPDYTRMDEIGNLTLAFTKMKDDLKKHVVLLDKSTTEKNKIMTEISVAAKIQKSIIPAETPIQLKEKGYDIHGLLKPAQTVGGDFYDFFMKDENTLYFVLGDVTGKGVPASFFMGMARTFFRTESKYVTSTSDLMFRINEDLCMNNPEAIFITIFCGILDLRKAKIEFTNAGHNFPVFQSREGHARILEQQHGPPVGLVKGQKYTSDQLSIQKKEQLLLYTDGVTEARDPSGAVFGEDRLVRLFKEIQSSARDSTAICHALVEKIETFESGANQSDDLSVLVLQRR